MHLKRYQRETVQDALRAVREDLGPEALVLSTRMVAARGLRGWFGQRSVEVTAAAERPAMSETRHETSPYRDIADRATQEIAARLEAAGVDASLARRVADAHPRVGRRGASIQSLRRTLAEQLVPLAAQDTEYAAVEVFVGPPGVGKTTTIAKIAAQERARRGKRLGIVAADGFRVGAVEQLRLYAEIIGAPLTVARTADDLEAALEGSRRTLLLDTAGRSPSDDMSKEMLRVLARRPGVRTHLVLSADSPVDALRRALDRFQDARPQRIVLTRLDEAESLAPLVGLLRDHQIPVSYLGTGQHVPRDLQVATPAALAAWVAADSADRGAVA